MKNLLIVAAALVGFAAAANATGTVKFPGADRSSEFQGRPIVPIIGSDLTVSDYWTYFPTADEARRHCNLRDVVVYDYGYKAYRCVPGVNNENGGQ